MINSKFVSDITNGALSSSFVTFFCQPLQVMRTSMMVTYKDGKVSNMTDVFRRIKTNEGIKGFYRGFYSAMIKTTLGSAIYFGILELSKDYMRHHYRTNNHLHNNAINFLASAFARTLQTIIVNPINVIKTRFEVVGFNSYNSIGDAIRKIRIEEGYRGYFKGLSQTLIKDVPSSAFFYSIYELFKKIYTNYLGFNNLQVQILFASTCANIILVVLTNPLEVIRARIQYLHFSKNDSHDYKGVIQGTLAIAREEGVRGLCVGIAPRFIKKAIGSAIVWTAYETLKVRSQKKRDILEFK